MYSENALNTVRQPYPSRAFCEKREKAQTSPCRAHFAINANPAALQ
jgi:hypothetical protein